MTLRISLASAAVLALVSVGSLPAMAQNVDFGDDSSAFSTDGECDDPRFEGTGMSAAPSDADLMSDASDCRKAFAAGTIALAAGGDMPVMDEPVAGAPDFGADTSDWANNGECDDPRFTGTGMAAVLLPEDTSADATDCRSLFEAGSITLVAGGDAPVTDEPAMGQPDFGADTSDWANNGECDDPRFTGTGMAAVLLPEDTMADATDCQGLFDAGSITLAAGGDITVPDQPAMDAPDFGADTSDWANHGECDDPRFAGTGMAAVLLPEDTAADATDCKALYDAGSITLVFEGDPPVTDGPVAGAPDFGADTSDWANNGECDDPRFSGTGMAAVLLPEDTMADATDCKSLFDGGSIALAASGDTPVTDDPVQTGAVDFGADSGQWTNDGECDDPRFVGQGMAEVLVDADLFADATDCRTLFDAGSITLKP